jgi:transcriptional regulator with XRE-family HTH domain
MPRPRDPDDIREAIGSRIAGARKRTNRTQAQLAAEVGVDSQTISKIERGLQTPMGTTLRGLSEALGVSSSWLLAGERESAEAAAGVEERLPAAAKQVIDEYLQSTHGRTAPTEVKARLRSGSIFVSMGVMSPGWRDIDDLRNILERQVRSSHGSLLTTHDQKPTGSYRSQSKKTQSKSSKRVRRGK